MIRRMIRDMAVLLNERLARATRPAAAIVLVLAGAAAPARADEFHLYSDSSPGSRFADVHWVGDPVAAIDVASLAPLETTSVPAYGIHALPATLDPNAPPPKLFTTGSTLVTAGTLVGGFLQGLGAPLQYGWQPWNTTNEGWFSRDTYVGGSDKVSHFVI